MHEATELGAYPLEAESRRFAAFATALDDLFRAVRRARGAETRAGDGGLSLSQLNLLDALTEDAPLTVGQLAERAGVTGPNATRMLDALERQGVVVRERTARDRRLVRARLTPAGHALVTRYRDWVRERQKRIYASLPASEREGAHLVLAHVAAAIDELAAGPDD